MKNQDLKQMSKEQLETLVIIYRDADNEFHSRMVHVNYFFGGLLTLMLSPVVFALTKAPIALMILCPLFAVGVRYIILKAFKETMKLFESKDKDDGKSDLS